MTSDNQESARSSLDESLSNEKEPPPPRKELTPQLRSYYEKRISCPEEGLKKSCIRLKKMGWHDAYRINMVSLNRCREELGLPSVTDPEDA